MVIVVVNIGEIHDYEDVGKKDLVHMVLSICAVVGSQSSPWWMNEGGDES